MHYPAASTAVLTVSGEVDDANVERLSSLVHQRLSGLLGALVLDLSGVGFLSLSAVEVFTRAAHRARANGPQLRLVVTTPAVRRAVQVAELQQVATCCSSLSQALSDLPPARTAPAPRDQHAPETASDAPREGEQP
ncbi:STAS domain-containing protein [Salinifilum aidingensis]